MTGGSRAHAFAGAAALTLAVVVRARRAPRLRAASSAGCGSSCRSVCGGAAGSLFVFRSRASAGRGRCRSRAAALLIGPAIWAVDTLGYATNSTFPAGGPQADNAATGPVRRRRIPAGAAPSPVAAGAACRGCSAAVAREPCRSRARPAARSAAAPGSAVAPGGGAFGGDPRASRAAESYARSHGGGTIAVGEPGGRRQRDHPEQRRRRRASAASAARRAIQRSPGWPARSRDGQIRWVLSSGIPTTGVGVRAGAGPALDAVAVACKPVASVSDLYDCGGDAAKLRAVS